MKRFYLTSITLSFLTLIVASFNAHAQNEFVDLGLSVTWATCNVGANSPEGNGEYYTFDNALTLENNGNRLPTKEEFQELIDNCTWLWTEEKGVKGYKVTSKKNSNCIFLPAAGKRDEGFDGPKVFFGGSIGYYWSSSAYNDENAYFLYFGEIIGMDYYDRIEERSVRLVQNVKK